MQAGALNGGWREYYYRVADSITCVKSTRVSIVSLLTRQIGCC